MSSPPPVVVQADEKAVDEHNKVFSQYESRVRRPLSRPTIVTKVLNAQEAREIAEKLKQRPVSTPLEADKGNDVSPPSEGMTP